MNGFLILDSVELAHAVATKLLASGYEVEVATDMVHKGDAGFTPDHADMFARKPSQLERRVFTLLANNEGSYFTAQDLVDATGAKDVRYARVAISRLRSKLSDDVTISHTRGMGYSIG